MTVSMWGQIVEPARHHLATVFSRRMSQTAPLPRPLRMTLQNQQVRTVILGAGYAGLMAATRLAQHQPPESILVIDASAVFVERIRLHQVAAGQRLREWPMTSLLPRGVGFVAARVTAIDPTRRTLTLAHAPAPHQAATQAATPTATPATTVEYEALIYALGSIDDRAQVPGAVAHTRVLGAGAAAAGLCAELATLAARGGRVTVLGGGLTGIEAATELAEAYPGLQLTLVSAGELAPGLGQRGREYIAKALARAGVTVRPRTRITEVTASALLPTEAPPIEFDMCIWSAGLRAPALAREAGLPVNERDQIEVDSGLRVIGHERIWAAGDAAQVSDCEAPIRMACATAMPLGAHVAEQVARMWRGQEPEPFRFGYVMQCISLGRRDGLIQLVDRNDRATARVIRGRLAAWIKERICWATIAVIRAERRLGRALYRWSKPAPRRPALAARAGEHA